MTSGEDFPTFDLDRLHEANFEIAWGNAIKKFEEAISLDGGGGRYLHWGRDWVKGFDDELVFFALTSDYTDAIEGKGETFELGVPVLPRASGLEVTTPVLAVPDAGQYFVWRKARDTIAQRVDKKSYSQLFETAQPLVENFGSKLWQYHVIGYKMRQQGA